MIACPTALDFMHTCSLALTPSPVLLRFTGDAEFTQALDLPAGRTVGRMERRPYYWSLAGGIGALAGGLLIGVGMASSSTSYDSRSGQTVVTARDDKYELKVPGAILVLGGLVALAVDLVRNHDYVEVAPMGRDPR